MLQFAIFSNLVNFGNIKRKQQVPYVRGCISLKRHVTLKITDNAIKQDILETFMYCHFSAFDFKGKLGLCVLYDAIYQVFTFLMYLNRKYIVSEA